MENKRVLKFFIKSTVFAFLFTLSFPVFTHAYAVATHENITVKTITEFNKLSSKKISNSFAWQIVKGVADEDDMHTSRPLYHFYDPNRPLKRAGLSDAPKTCASFQHSKICESAPLWARDVLLEQASYRWDLSKDDTLFSDPEDYTFDKAVYEYVHGDKKRAMQELGHIMHLVQDMTSVPHTRDDAHPNLQGTKFSWLDWSVEEEHSFYEDFTANKSIKELQNINLKTIRKYRDLNDIFYYTALFTNRNFLSRDTIFEKYKKPVARLNTADDNMYI